MFRKIIGKLLGSSEKTDAPAAGKTSRRGSGTGKDSPPDQTAPDSSRRRRGGRNRRRKGGAQEGRAEGSPREDQSRGGDHRRSEERSRADGPPRSETGGPKKRRRSRGRRGADRGPRGDQPRSSESGRSPRDSEEPNVEAASAAPARRPAAPREPAAPIEIPAIADDNEFTFLGLEPRLVAAVESLGFIQPTPIQSEAIPFVLQGRDLIGSAQTGTGKTAAFALPVLQKLGSSGSLRCLVLEPTRELALQVDEAFHAYGKFSDLKTTVIYGGVGYGPQREAIERGVDAIVATPGRLLDLISQQAFSLSGIEYLILDEVDRMLDMGFLPDVKRIIAMCPKERQTLFFSATIPPELEKLTEWVLKDPHTIEIGRRRSAAETVSHAFYPVIESQKFDLLQALLEITHYESVLIFCRTKHGADFVSGRLENQGHKVAVMHSNRSQRERTEALAGFKSGKYEVLVATDVAARGLDIAGISHVINFDTPLHPEDYVHRIGRTGRASNEGDAFTLLTEDEMKYAAAIERFIGKKVERKKLEDFPYQYSAVFAQMEGEPKNVFRSRLYRGTRG